MEKQFYVPNRHASVGTLTKFQKLYTNAQTERPMQKFLEKFPELLLAVIAGGGAGRWIIPQARLGGQYVTDFLIADKDNLGTHWLAVEIESPKAPVVTKKR